MALKLSNNASGLLALAISDSDTSLTLEAGHGSRFPALGSGDWFPITVVRASDPSQFEIMRCTARTLDTLTVERAQEGTSALAFDPGDVVELRLTSGTLEENFPQVEGRNAKNLRFSIDSVGGKPELKFKSGDDEETVVRRSDVGTSAGNVMEVGAFGLGGVNDLRNTIYTTGTPKDLYGRGYVIGFTDGSQLSPPIGTSNNYGTLEVKFQWNDSSGRPACSRTFTTADRVFVQRAVDDDTWGPWREHYHTGNIDKLISDLNLVDLKRMVLRGIPFPFPGNTPPPGTIAYNGAELLRADFPELWAWAQQYAVVVPDAQWHANRWGAFSSGNGVTTFRVPDLRGEFIRGWDAGRALGSWQTDALQNITGQVGSVIAASRNVYANASGAFYLPNNRDNGAVSNINGSYGGDTHLRFDASRVARTANETRPRNIAYLICAFY